VDVEDALFALDGTGSHRPFERLVHECAAEGEQVDERSEIYHVRDPASRKPEGFASDLEVTRSGSDGQTFASFQTPMSECDQLISELFGFLVLWLALTYCAASLHRYA